MDAEQYFIVKVQYDLPDENTGRVRKIREEKLVKDYTVTGCEAKITEKFKGFSYDWKITSVSESKIDEVID